MMEQKYFNKLNYAIQARWEIFYKISEEGSGKTVSFY